MQNNYQTPTFLETQPDKNYKPILDEYFIIPLNKLGFELISYSHVFNPDFPMGTHILCFTKITDQAINTDTFHKICTQDDDNQPHATYSLYFGSLFLYIPYIG